MNKISRYVFVLAPLAGCFAAPIATANDVNIKYSIRYSVLPVGTASLKGSITDTVYNVEATAKPNTITSMFSSANILIKAAGAFGGGKLLPKTYSMTKVGEKTPHTISMTIAGGDVVGLEVNPPNDQAPDRVPVTESDKHGIIDPLGSYLMPYTGEFDKNICNRTLPIFDGWMRFDINLTYQETKNIKIKGYTGPVMVCSVRYVPISGHRLSRKVTKDLANSRKLEIWLAPLRQAHVAIPYKYLVSSMSGTFSIEAVEFNTEP